MISGFNIVPPRLHITAEGITVTAPIQPNGIYFTPEEVVAAQFLNSVFSEATKYGLNTSCISLLNSAENTRSNQAKFQYFVQYGYGNKFGYSLLTLISSLWEKSRVIVDCSLLQEHEHLVEERKAVEFARQLETTGLSNGSFGRSFTIRQAHVIMMILNS